MIPCVTFNNAGVNYWSRTYWNCPFDTEGHPARAADELAAAVAGKLPYMVSGLLQMFPSICTTSINMTNNNTLINPISR